MDADSLGQEDYWQILLSVLGVLLLVVMLSGCQVGSRREFPISSTVSSGTSATVTLSAMPTCTPIPTSSLPNLRPTWTPTPAAPPEGTVALDVVDVSQAPITLPVRGQLLVEVRRRKSSGYEVGLLDLENSQFVRVWSLVSNEIDYCGHLYWSPDGTHFVCEWKDIVPSSTWIIFSLNSKAKRSFHIRHYGDIAWSPDGRYFVSKECVGNYPQPASIYSVYDASTWSKVASVGWTHPMAGCAYNSPIQSQFADQYCNNDITWNYHSQPSSSLYCRLPLEDGRGWLLAVGGGLRSMLCTSPAECPDIETAELAEYSYSQNRFQSERYQAMVENYWLRMVDTETGVQTTYVIPEYRIVTIAWSPD
jgi:hypothetical protein